LNSRILNNYFYGTREHNYAVKNIVSILKKMLDALSYYFNQNFYNKVAKEN